MASVLHRLDALGVRHSVMMSISAAVLGMGAVLMLGVLAVDAVFSGPNDLALGYHSNSFAVIAVIVGGGWVAWGLGVSFHRLRPVVSVRSYWTAGATFVAVTAAVVAVFIHHDRIANAEMNTTSYAYGERVMNRYVYGIEGERGSIAARCAEELRAHPGTFAGYDEALAMKGCRGQEFALDN